MGGLLLGTKEHRGLLTIAEGNALMREDVIAGSGEQFGYGFRMTVHQGVTPFLRGVCTLIHCEFLSEGKPWE